MYFTNNQPTHLYFFVDRLSSMGTTPACYLKLSERKLFLEALVFLSRLLLSILPLKPAFVFVLRCSFLTVLLS